MSSGDQNALRTTRQEAQRNMWPAWNQTAVAAVVVTAFVVLTRPVAHQRWDLVRATARELTVVLVLYSIWQYGESLSLRKLGRGIADGRWVWRVERTWHLPSELALQHHLIGHRLLTQAADLYYAAVHGPALGAFLIWLWFRHRDRYPRVRNNLALVTGACLLIQLVPVAPPRMYPGLGFVDTLQRFGPFGVYGPVGHGLSDQVGAMPSIHCAWALLVGLGVVSISRSRWRWLALAHPAVTFLVVAATGNHWWLDGIVAGVMLALAALAQRAVVAGWARATTRLRSSRPGPAVEPVPVPALARSGPSRAAPGASGQ